MIKNKLPEQVIEEARTVVQGVQNKDVFRIMKEHKLLKKPISKRASKITSKDPFGTLKDVKFSDDEKEKSQESESEFSTHKQQS